MPGVPAIPSISRIIARWPPTFEAIAARKGCSPSQLALAWLLAQGDDVVVIPGTRYATRLDENAAATGIALTPAEIEEIAGALPKGSASGERDPAAPMKGVYL
jgi:aryl-alcohol dehydrogenase-like predicted oxidoreductase